MQRERADRVVGLDAGHRAAPASRAARPPRGSARSARAGRRASASAFALYSGYQSSRKVLPLRVEDAGGVVGAGYSLAQQLHHVTMPRIAPVAGLRVAGHGAQVGHRVVGAVEIARAVDEQQGLVGHRAIVPCAAMLVGRKCRHLRTTPACARPTILPCIARRLARLRHAPRGARLRRAAAAVQAPDRARAAAASRRRRPTRPGRTRPPAGRTRRSSTSIIEDGSATHRRAARARPDRRSITVQPKGGAPELRGPARRPARTPPGDQPRPADRAAPTGKRVWNVLKF